MNQLKDMIDFLLKGDFNNMFNACMNAIPDNNDRVQTVLDVHEHFHRKIKIPDPLNGNGASMPSDGYTVLEPDGKSLSVEYKDRDRFLNEVILSYANAESPEEVKEAQPFQLEVLEQKLAELKEAIEDNSLLSDIDHQLRDDVGNNRISNEKAIDDLSFAEYKMENFIKTLNKIKDKEFTIDQSSEFEKTMIAAEKFEALLAYMHESEYNPYAENEAVEKALGKIGIDGNQKFVQAGVLMFGLDNHGGVGNKRDFVATVKKTCRNCAEDFQETAHKKQSEIYKATRGGVPKGAKVKRNGVGFENPEAKNKLNGKQARQAGRKGVRV